MKLTFTLEAIAGMDATRLGDLIKHRVGIGAKVIEIVTLDEAIGRLSAMGVPLVGDVSTITVPVEVESLYPAPTPDEIDQLLAKVATTGYASEAGEIVETWLEERYGVVGDYTRKLREETALRNVEEVGMSRWKTLDVFAEKIEKGEIRVDTSMVADPLPLPSNVRYPNGDAPTPEIWPSSWYHGDGTPKTAEEIVAMAKRAENA